MARTTKILIRRLSRIVRDAELSEADISMPNKIDVLGTLEYAHTLRLFSDDATKQPNFNAIVGAADHARDVHWLLTCTDKAKRFSKDVDTKQTTFDEIMATVHKKQEEEAAAHPSAMGERESSGRERPKF